MQCIHLLGENSHSCLAYMNDMGAMSVYRLDSGLKYIINFRAALCSENNSRRHLHQQLYNQDCFLLALASYDLLTFSTHLAKVYTLYIIIIIHQAAQVHTFKPY